MKDVIKTRFVNDPENPWRNKEIIGGDGWLLCDTDKDFIQCKARIKELSKAGKAIFKISKQGDQLTTAQDFEEAFNINLDDYDLFINPFRNAKDFYVWGKDFTKEQTKKLIRIKFN